MDRERKVVHQLDDTVYENLVRYFGVIQISDNYNSRRCNRASCVLFHAVAETIEPKTKTKAQKHKINNSYKCNFSTKQKFESK